MRAWQWCFSGVRTVTRTPPIGISRCQNQWERCNLVPTACLSSRTRPVDRSGASTGVAGRVIGCRMVAWDVVARSPAAMRCARWPVAVAIAQVTADSRWLQRGEARRARMCHWLRAATSWVCRLACSTADKRYGHIILVHWRFAGERGYASDIVEAGRPAD